MSSFCGVTSNKPAKGSKPCEKRTDDLMTFQDLERDVHMLHEEIISLQPDFMLKSEVVQEWQFEVYENGPQLKLLLDQVDNVQKALGELEKFLERIAKDLERIDSALKPIEIVTNKIQCNSCNFEPQRYQMYTQLLECFKEIKAMEKVWLNCEEIAKIYELAKSGSVKDILFYHVRILENIEEKMNSLESLQELNDNTLQYIQKGNDFKTSPNGGCSICNYY